MPTTDSIIPIGILLIFLGLIVVFIGALAQSQKQNSDVKVAVGGFVGFIPFGFGNDKKMVYAVFGIAAVIAVLWILANAKFLR